MDGIEIQRKIVALLSVKGNLSLAELAKHLRLKPHIVRYQLQLLIESKKLRRSVLFDHRSLGFRVCNFFFDLTSGSRQSVLNFLKKRREISWLAHNIGRSEFEMSVVVRDPLDVIGLFEALGEATGAHIENQRMAYEEDVYFWGLRFLAPDQHVSRPTELKADSVFDADSLDMRILRACGTHEDLQIARLPRDLGIPSSTLKYRLERLQSAGVISEEKYFIRDEGRAMPQAQLVFQLARRSKAARRELTLFCQQCPNVVALISCAGSWDFKMLIMAEQLGDILNVEERCRSHFKDTVADLSLLVRRELISISPGF